MVTTSGTVATPGAVVYATTREVTGLHRELAERPYRFLRPGLGEGATGGPCLDLLDPVGNTLRIEEKARGVRP